MSFQPTNAKDKNTYKPSLFVGAIFYVDFMHSGMYNIDILRRNKK